MRARDFHHFLKYKNAWYSHLNDETAKEYISKKLLNTIFWLFSNASDWFKSVRINLRWIKIFLLQKLPRNLWKTKLSTFWDKRNCCSDSGFKSSPTQRTSQTFIHIGWRCFLTFTFLVSQLSLSENDGRCANILN